MSNTPPRTTVSSAPNTQNLEYCDNQQNDADWNAVLESAWQLPTVLLVEKKANGTVWESTLTEPPNPNPTATVCRGPTA